MTAVRVIDNYKYQGLRYGIFTIHSQECDCKSRFGRLTGRKVVFTGTVESLEDLAVKLMVDWYNAEMPGYGYGLNIRPDDALEDMTLAICLNP
jgi:hypothetical protein